MAYGVTFLKNPSKIRLVQAQKSDLKFSMDVPGKGQVEGVLYYFPFHNAAESLPVEDFNLVHNPITHYGMTQQQPGGNQMTQPPASQLPRLTQALKGAILELGTAILDS